MNAGEQDTAGEPETSVLATGVTTVTELAVSKVAAAAARAVPGVHTLGLGANRALGAIRGAVSGTSGPVHGVSSEIGATQAAVDIVLTADYGPALHELAASVRAAVYVAVEQLTSFRVIEVNIEIGDVYVPEPSDEGPRAVEAGSGGTP
ncbi:Asp23/Gls24 family envelope stress response protein [Paeniglutamicibacter cryotolerans]|nr:Asp23/Gls24 family envelope stress response protein [Paeniglutamicibacter cryotolerans]